MHDSIRSCTDADGERREERRMGGRIGTLMISFVNERRSKKHTIENKRRESKI